MANRGHPQAGVYLIGDSTLDVGSNLRSLLRQSYNPLLQAFFHAAYLVLRAEIAGLASIQRAAFPRFSSIQDLLSQQRRTPLHPALQHALVCCSQLATVISRCGEADDIFVETADIYLVGLCTGALTAAAISASRHANDLLRIAPHATGVAFRVALCAWEGARLIEPDSTEPWSITVATGETKEISKLLQDYAADKRLPSASRPYMSFSARSCLTVSGPPSVLRELQATELVGHRTLHLPLYLPYHAPHLWTSEDVDAVLATSSSSDWSRYKARLPVISSATGTISPARDYLELLRDAVTDILMKPIVWEDTIHGIAYLARFSRAQLSIRGIGTIRDKNLSKSLKELGLDVETTSIQPALSSTVPETSTREKSSGAYSSASGKSKLAIVGLSGRFPGAQDTDVFWDLLFKGLDVHSVVPPSRWSTATHVDATGKRKNTSKTPFGCWLDNPGMFDAKFFNVTPREAPQIDPAHRLALMVVYEAMENAGMVPGSTPSTMNDRVGVAFGISENDWMEVNSAQDIDTYFIPGGCRAFLPGRVNYFFKFSGPSLALDTACSSSLAAMHTACNALWQGDIDTAVVGGSNVLTNPDYTAGLDRGQFLSPTGNCKSFDQSADGYCRAEATTAVIIKRLDDAIAEKDPILGVILAAGTNHSAESDSITRPLAEAQKALFNKILDDASIDPHDVGYVEMHGTGTRAGDPVEMESVLDTCAPSPGQAASRPIDKPLYVGAVKSNVGHGEGAAGATSLAKVLLMLQHGKIPPHAGLRTTLNEAFPKDMDERNAHIARRPLDWTRANAETPLRALINNFSAAGGNSALLLEQAPQLPISPVDEVPDLRSTHIVAVSAKTAASLRGNVEALRNFLLSSAADNVSLPALSYTTTARRAHHPYRVAIRGTNLEEIRAGLEAAISQGHDAIPRPPARSSSAASPGANFVFTGNGAQYVGMGRDLIQALPSFREDITRLDRMLRSQGFDSMMPFFAPEASKLEDFDAVTIQVATLSLQLALARLWISWGVRPLSTVGHSLGMYAALAVAGVLSEADALFLVARRAQLLTQRCRAGSHAMIAVRGADQGVLDRVLSGPWDCEVSCINGPKDVVLAGPVHHLKHVSDHLMKEGVPARMLTVPYAFHSAQMDPILEEFEVACQGVTFGKPTIPVIDPLDPAVITEAGTISPQYLRRHCREPVDMLSALRAAHETGILVKGGVALEIGPHPAVCGMVKSVLGSSTMTTLASLRRDEDSFSVLARALSSLYSLGYDISWREYHAAFPAAHHVVKLPAYQWDLKNYWIQYVNDWSLRKGDPLPEPLQVMAQPPASLLPPLEGAMIHRIVSDSVAGTATTIVVETDLSRPDTRPLVQGHRVADIPLVTPAVYAEVALRVGRHIVGRQAPGDDDTLVVINDMAVERALVAHGGSAAQILRTTVAYDGASKQARCTFETIGDGTQKPRKHSTCNLELVSRTQASADLQEQANAAASRMDGLKDEVSRGTAFRFSKAMAYRMVGVLADFDKEYRRMDEVILNSDSMDASTIVSFDSLDPRVLNEHPAIIDGLAQSAGFIMNANEEADLLTEVFVNHGWESSRVFQTIEATKKYRTYCKMQKSEVAKCWKGDCIVMGLDSNEPVAFFGGITLQGVPRRALELILSSESRSSGGASTIRRKETNTYVGSDAKASELPTSMHMTLTHTEKKAIRMEPPAPVSKPIPEAAFHFTRSDASASESEDGSRSSRDSSVTPDSSTTSLSSGTADLFSRALQIIAEESGVEVEELVDDAVFADLGIDSLLSLMVMARFRDELDLKTDDHLSNITVFAEGPTVRDLKRTLGAAGSPETVIPPAQPVLAPKQAPVVPPPVTVPLRPASSVILRGRPTADRHVLWLFPDGAGSAVSYAPAAACVRPGLAIVGLNCPYYRHPAELATGNLPLDTVLDAYLSEMRRRQPVGPYHVGGWSSGGILAYAAAQRLIREGERVDSLILIDAPPPTGLDPLPDRWYAHCEASGVFGDGKNDAVPSSMVVEHFRAQIKLLQNYVAEPLPEGVTPRTSIVWPSRCVFDGRPGRPVFETRADDPKGIKFLTEPRTDWTAGEWEPLFPLDPPDVSVMEDCDHFSMMQVGKSECLGKILSESVM